MKDNKRNGCKDIWNAFMCEGASFSKNDIPFCPTTSSEIPRDLILWDDAKAIYKRRIHTEPSFHCEAFVCFYMDDYKFDGPKGIWNNSIAALDILRHFSGAITPDFSTYQDFPEPVKIYNTYRMRAFGYWLGKNGISVINNVRWGTEETWKYCWDGISQNSIIAIGTVGGSPRRTVDRQRFITGFQEAIVVLSPKTILVYGSAKYPCFDEVKSKGITVLSFQSRTAKAFERRSPEK